MTQQDTIETYYDQLTDSLSEYIFSTYSSNWSTSRELAQEYIERLMEAEGSISDMYDMESAPYGVYYSSRRDWWERLELSQDLIACELEDIGKAGVLSFNDLVEMQLGWIHIQIIGWLIANHGLKEQEATDEI